MSRRGKLAALVFILAAAFAGGLAVQRGPKGEAYNPIPTVVNASPPGLRALALTLKALGESADIWRGDFRNLPDRGGVLVLAAPVVRPLTPHNSKELLAWVARGNTFVLALAGSPFDDFAFDPLWEEIGVRPGDAPPAPSALESLALDLDAERPTASPALPDPAVRRVRRVELRASAGLRAPPRGLVVLDGERLPFMVRVDRGEGMVYVLASAWPLCNEGLGRADNLGLAVGLLAGRHAVFFDEYHHGFGPSEENPLTAHPSFALAMAQAGLLAVLFVAVGLRRFGPIRPGPTRKRRTTGEFVESLTNLLLKSRAHRRLLDRRLEVFGKRLARALHVAGTAGPMELLERAAQHGRIEAARASDAARRLDRLAKKARLGRRDLAEAARIMSGVEDGLRLPRS